MLAPPIAVRAEPKIQSSSKQGDFVIYAGDLALADAATQKAEEVLAQFESRLKIESRPANVPIIGVFQAGEGTQEGAIRVFARRPGYKLQINWNQERLLPDAYRRTWVRAFCIREAIHRTAESDSFLQEMTFRVPVWIPDGIAALLEDPDRVEETMARVNLLAKVEPNFSLDDFALEMLGQREDDPARRAVSAFVCAQLISSDETRARMLQSLNWGPKTTVRDWLQSVLGNRDTEKWWREIWNHQATQFSVLRLSVRLSELELFQSLENQSAAVESVLHPWFASYLASRFPGDARHRMTREDLTDLTMTVRAHRLASLDWIDQFSDGKLGREELLDWKSAHSNPITSPPGPIRQWFDTLAK